MPTYGHKSKRRLHGESSSVPIACSFFHFCASWKLDLSQDFSFGGRAPLPNTCSPNGGTDGSNRHYR